MAECDPCGRYFATYHGYIRHMQTSSRHNYCDTCDRDFSTWNGLHQHWTQSQRHSYCRRCQSHFDDDEDLWDHYHDAHHFCSKCNQFFENEYGLTEHYRQSDNHHYCVECQREFSGESNLRSHMNSSRHRAQTFQCPGRGCEQAFVSTSALILHLEAGYCPGGFDRPTVNRLVKQYDRNHVITDPARLIGYDSTETTYTANGRAWNGSMYECYLCHGEYRTLASLNQHLASPRHQSKIYICPLESCRVRFNTLSALCQHVESEKCGVSKFKQVQNVMDNVVSRMGRLTF
ncbi:hypothetical protein HGRIS_008682 [Hohenbuehelia grisea]|uniref:C2H2-type domain-containing protein n=1 Tax=Hohenbuehelia grisea TaxID=104357 RepID=A0ABR3J8P9_9AGAR